MSNAYSSTSTNEQLIAEPEQNESYFQLVWRRFRRSTVSIVGALMVLAHGLPIAPVAH